jgi:hypothetical protein
MLSKVMPEEEDTEEAETSELIKAARGGDKEKVILCVLSV